MWILLSSVVIMFALELNFLIGVGTVCFSGVTLNTARPIVISCASGDTDISGQAADVDTVSICIGEVGLSPKLLLPVSTFFSREKVVIVTGDIDLSGDSALSNPLPFCVMTPGEGIIVIRGFCVPKVGITVVLEKKSSEGGLVISKVAVLFSWSGVTLICNG